MSSDWRIADLTVHYRHLLLYLQKEVNGVTADGHFLMPIHVSEYGYRQVILQSEARQRLKEIIRETIKHKRS